MRNHGYRILLVEDNPGDVALVKREIQRNSDYQLVDAPRMSSALPRLEQERFDLVLLDLSLPDASGLEGLRQLTTSQPKVPVVVLTGNVKEEMGLEAVREGAQDYLVKGTYTPREFFTKIEFAVERARVFQQLVQSQWLQSLGVVAKSVAQDLTRYQDTILDLALEAIQASSKGQSDLNALERLQNCAQRAHDLAQQMFEYGPEESATWQRIHPVQTIQEMTPLLRAILPAGVSLKFEFGPSTPRIVAKRNQLWQVVQNLVTNGVDSLYRETGVVTLRTSERRGEGSDEDLTQLVLEVGDTGCGMPEETLSQAFLPFFSTKGSTRGLGLTVVKSIVQQLGGEVSLASKPGEGTTVTVLLPAVPGGEYLAEPANDL